MFSLVLSFPLFTTRAAPSPPSTTPIPNVETAGGFGSSSSSVVRTSAPVSLFGVVVASGLSLLIHQAEEAVEEDTSYKRSSNNDKNNSKLIFFFTVPPCVPVTVIYGVTMAVNKLWM